VNPEALKKHRPHITCRDEGLTEMNPHESAPAQVGMAATMDRRETDAVSGLAPVVKGARSQVGMAATMSRRGIDAVSEHGTVVNGVISQVRRLTSSDTRGNDAVSKQATIVNGLISQVRDETPYPETAMDALRLVLPALRQVSRLIRSHDEYDAIVAEINEALCSNIQFRQGRTRPDELVFP
jgi:hypothetical protein